MAEEERSEDEMTFSENDDDFSESGEEDDQESSEPGLSSHNCGVCLLPMKDAVQTKCGHRFCGVCLKRSIR